MENKIQWALSSLKYITFGWMMPFIAPEGPERFPAWFDGEPVEYIGGFTGNETPEERAVKLWQFFSK